MVPVELIVNELAGAWYDIADCKVQTAELLLTLPQSSIQKKKLLLNPCLKFLRPPEPLFLPKTKLPLEPPTATFPRFKSTHGDVFLIPTLPELLKPPKNKLKLPVVIAPIMLTLPELSILNVGLLLELL